MTCEFEGTAQSVHIRGRGPVIFVRKSIFAAGLAERVEIHTGWVEGSAPIVNLIAPRKLDPIALDIGGAAYDATYTFERPVMPGRSSVTVVVEQGGASEGDFQGDLPRELKCSLQWCKIKWNAGQAKKLTIFTSNERVAEFVKDGKHPELTEPFPYVAADDTGPVMAQVTGLWITGARGNLRCDDGTRIDRSSLEWQTSATDSFRLSQGIALTLDGLGVHVTSSASPIVRSTETPAEPSAAPLPPPYVPLSQAALVGGALTTTILLFVALAAVRRRRNATQKSRDITPQAEPSTQGDAVGDAEISESPVILYLFYAARDWELFEKLQTHLRPLTRSGKCSYRPQAVSAGTSWRSQVEQSFGDRHLIVLLVSPCFLDADDTNEASRAANHVTADAGRLVPVRLRPVAGWNRELFGRLQALPRNGLAVTECNNEDAVLSEIVSDIEKAIDDLRGHPR